MVTIWELDFYSRPILDERNKKRWEVLISEGPQTVADNPEGLFRYSKFLSNTQINSLELQAAIEEAITEAGAPPNRIRFFRLPMQAMITRACEALGIAAKPSRRTLALQQWLDYRKTEVYPHEPGYTDKPSPTVAAPPPSPRPLPDALVGQQWAFVNLPAKEFAEMPDWSMDFGEAFPLSLAAVEPDTMIPGIVIFSPRATAMAAWMSGLELAEIQIESTQSPRLILETGAAESWVLSPLGTPDLQKEAKNFEATKRAANQVHFLALQISAETEAFAGFWLMQGLQLG
jgi:hypothetical protein